MIIDFLLAKNHHKSILKRTVVRSPAEKLQRDYENKVWRPGVPAFPYPRGLGELFASPKAQPECLLKTTKPNGQEKNRNARSPDIIFLTPLEM